MPSLSLSHSPIPYFQSRTSSSRRVVLRRRFATSLFARCFGHAPVARATLLDLCTLRVSSNLETSLHASIFPRSRSRSPKSLLASRSHRTLVRCQLVQHNILALSDGHGHLRQLQQLTHSRKTKVSTLRLALLEARLSARGVASRRFLLSCRSQGRTLVLVDYSTLEHLGTYTYCFGPWLIRAAGKSDSHSSLVL
jgi:hypothetical protein